ncbi:MAG: hypothetical protein OEY85_09345, partial [Rhodospirillales bacterium]|nr:hypothetical protein [Rhodospirillales bacterium]
GATGLAVLVFYLLILGTSYDPKISAPMSCPGEIGNRFFETWAHMIAGREPPPCFPDRTKR